MGTKVIAVTRKMESRDKDQTYKTDIHNKELNVTEIIIHSNKYRSATPLKTGSMGQVHR